MLKKEKKQFKNLLEEFGKRGKVKLKKHINLFLKLYMNLQSSMVALLLVGKEF